MGMKINEVIQSLTAMKSVIGVNQLTINEAVEAMYKCQKIKNILNTNVVYRDSDFMKLSAIKRVIDGDKQEDIFWKFIDEVEDEQ